MEFSVFFFGSDDGDVGPGKYDLLMRSARFADSAGFAAVWTPERHFGGFGGRFPNPTLCGAAVAAVTERVDVRAGSVVLPLHDVVRVAEDWAVLDNLSGGRTGLSFASGWHPNDFVLAPHAYANRKEVLLRELDIFRRLWRGEAISRPGGVGGAVEVAICPRPLQPEPRVWLTTAGTPGTAAAAGRAGTNLLTHMLGQSDEALADRVMEYRRARARSGHDANAGVVTVMLHAYLDRDVARVKDVIRDPFRAYLRDSLRLTASQLSAEGRDAGAGRMSSDDVEALLDYSFDRYFTGNTLFGTVDSCMPVVRRLESAGVDELACLVDFGVDTELALRSLELIAELAGCWRPAATSRPPRPV